MYSMSKSNSEEIEALTPLAFRRSSFLIYPPLLPATDASGSGMFLTLNLMGAKDILSPFLMSFYS